MYIKKGRSTKLFERVIPITKTRSKEKNPDSDFVDIKHTDKHFDNLQNQNTSMAIKGKPVKNLQTESRPSKHLLVLKTSSTRLHRNNFTSSKTS